MNQRNEFLGIFLGISLVIGMHIFGTLFAFFIVVPLVPFFQRDYNALLIPGWIGLWQLVYVIPVVIWLNRQQRSTLMKGVIAGAVITALLNGACWISVTR